MWQFRHEEREMRYAVKTEQSLSNEDIANIVITAFEGGSNYWIENTQCVYRNQKGEWTPVVEDQYAGFCVDGVGPYANEEFWHNDSFGYRVWTEEGRIEKVLTASGIVKALHYQPPQRKGQSNNWMRKVVDRILNEEYDANDADVVVQIATLGEEVYG